ncbi:MAG: DUF2147 domain-containing protein [Luteibaculaceae bacterium]
MKKSILSSILAVIFITLSAFTQNTGTPKADAILGDWVNQKQDAKFTIYKIDDVYYGKIIWGSGRETKDVKNPDVKLRSRELTGLTILKDFTYKGDNLWENGTIYDPNDGKTYSCKITMIDNNKIDVRGFVGVSLFGRTETWTRIKK